MCNVLLAFKQFNRCAIDNQNDQSLRVGPDWCDLNCDLNSQHGLYKNEVPLKIKKQKEQNSQI